MLKPKTIILLIHFEGNQVLGDEMTNNLRFSYLKSLLFNACVEDFYNLLIVSDHINAYREHKIDAHHPKIAELQRMSNAEGRHTWINIYNEDGGENKNDVNSIVLKAAKLGYEIQNVIIGGTNTNGCIFGITNYSALQWAQAGYPVQIFLPMCADYQQAGLNQIETNIMAFSELYTQMQEHNVCDKININARMDNLWLNPETPRKGIGE